MNNITVKDLLGVAREKNSKHYEMPPVLTIKDKTVQTSNTSISDMLSIVRKNKSDNDIKELNPFYEHDVYESAKREANGHIDMLSNMSNSGESVLDDASYVELEKYFDVNVVYDSDGRALSGNEVLQKYGVTSKSSGVVSENVDTDGLAGIIIDQVNNQKKSPREEVYDGLSPYLTETENARLFSDEAKKMFNAPEGVYQSDHKDWYDYSVNKADNYIGKYDLIIGSIEKNRQLLGDEWADGAIKNANEILDFYKQVKIDAQNYYDYWNQFESEEQYYDYIYAKKYSQSTYGELTSQKNYLYKKMRTEGADTDSIKREIAWIDAHMYDLFYVFSMTEEEITEYDVERKKQGLGSELGYTEDGQKITTKNVYAIAKAKKTDEKIQSTPELKSMWDDIELTDDDYDRAADLHLTVSALSKQSRSNIYDRLTEEQKDDLGYLCKKYGISDITSDKDIINATYELEKLVGEKGLDKIAQFEKQGLNYDEYHYYRKMQKDAQRARELAKSDAEFAREHPFLASVLGIAIAPFKIYDLLDNAKYSVLSFGDSGSVYSIANYDDDGFVNMNRNMTGSVSELIGEKVYDKTGSELLAGLAKWGYSGAMSRAQSFVTDAVCTAVFGPFGKVISLGVLGAEAAADAFNETARNGNLSVDAMRTSIAAGMAEIAFENLPFDELFGIGKDLKASEAKGVIQSILKNSKNAAVQGLFGGSSELCTELTNFVSDLFINQDTSEFALGINEYVRQGKTKEQAFVEALKDKGIELLGAFSGGFIGDAITSYTSALNTNGTNTVGNTKTGIINSDNYNTIRELQLAKIQKKAITDPDGARKDLRAAMDATLTVSETTTDKQLKSKADSDLERMMKFAQENGIDVSAESSVTQSSNENDHGSERSEGNILQQNIATANAQDSTVTDSKHQNRTAVKKTATQQKSEVDRESVIRGAYDKVSSSPEALDKVISEMRADGINIETLMATERERILGSLSRAYSEAKYSSMQGDNRGIISYLEAVETAAKDPNYIKRLIAAEYLAQKQLASFDPTESMAIESHSADMSDAADISYSEQTSNSVENISVDNSAENGIIETRKNFTTERVETEIFWCKKPHTNRTPGHWETICDEVELMKQSGKYVRIYANKKLSNEVSHPIPNRRPDIMAVRHDGLIDQVEVPSKTDKVYLLDIRMRDNQRIFGDRAGKTKIRYIDQKGETLWIK